MPNLTLSTSVHILAGQNFTNGGQIDVAVFTNSGSTQSAGITVVTSGGKAAVTVNKSSVSPGGSGTTNDFTITAPSVTGNYEVRVIQSIKSGNDIEVYSGLVRGTVSSGSTGSAPVISSVTNNNASSANVTATVNLSSSGSGGTLQYAQTSSNSAPSSGWQSGNTFSHPRGTTRYYWARQSSSLVSSSASHAVGYIAPDTAVSPSNIIISNTATSGNTTIRNVTAGETYQVRNNAGTITYATVTGFSTSVVASISSGLPTAGNTTTFRIYAKRPTSAGGDNAYDNTGDTFTIQRQTSGGSGGSAAYGLEVRGPNGTTPVFGTNLLATNFVVAQSFSIAGGQSTTITCAEANDDSKVLIFFSSYKRGITVSTTSTNFTLTNALSGTQSGTVFAIRRR